MLLLVERQTNIVEQYLVDAECLGALINDFGLFNEYLIIRNVPDYLKAFLTQQWDAYIWFEKFVCDSPILY